MCQESRAIVEEEQSFRQVLGLEEASRKRNQPTIYCVLCNVKNADLCTLATLAGMERVMRGSSDQFDAISEMSWTMLKLARARDLE